PSTAAAAAPPPRPPPPPWPRACLRSPSARPSRWPPTGSCCATPAAPRNRSNPANPRAATTARRWGGNPPTRAKPRANNARSRNAVASLIVAAYHTAGQTNGQNKQPYPLPEHLDKITAKDAETLLRETEAAIKEKDQARAAALVQRYGEQGHPERPVFDLLLK